MIHLYWKNATADVVGPAHGVTGAELASSAERLARAHAAVLAQWDQGKLGYAALPDRTDYRDEVMALVARRRPQTTDLVVLGIGGSALGSIALQTALNPATYNLQAGRGPGSPRLFVLDNVDPALVRETLDMLAGRLETTLFNVISKSGRTAETAAQFMIVRRMLRDRLGEDFWGRIVATTDPQTGPLHEVALAEGYDLLPVPPDVGGRFSVLSAVGLFSAAMCGIDIDALLGGARQMARRIRQQPAPTNPACVLAAIKHLMYAAKGKPIHVMMPYSNRLYGLADWYRQLWAESLGKAASRGGDSVCVGPTPIKALGATDQHSQIQLYREGPNDKLVVFLAAAAHPVDVEIPSAPADVEAQAWLGGKTLSQLLVAEMTATEYALASSARPSVAIRFDAVDAESVGEFIFLYEFVTSLMGELLDIDAYDQPAVQFGKDATFALLGRGGYERLAKAIRPFTTLDEDYLV